MNRLKRLGLELLLATSMLGMSEAEARPNNIPCQIKKTDIAHLESAVNAYISCSKKQGTLKSTDEISWLIADARTGVKIVDINANSQRQAASMIKPFVALAYFSQVDSKMLHYTARDRKKMVEMLRYSSNSATNYFIDLLKGPKKVDDILKQYESAGSEVVIVERIPRNGRSYKNKASAEAYRALLYDIMHEKIPYASELRRIMGLNNGRHTRIYNKALLDDDVDIINKTGTTKRVVGDIGVLGTSEKGIIVVGIVENKRDSLWPRQGKIRKFMQNVSAASWNSYSKK